VSVVFRGVLLKEEVWKREKRSVGTQPETRQFQ